MLHDGGMCKRGVLDFWKYDTHSGLWQTSLLFILLELKVLQSVAFAVEGSEVTTGQNCNSVYNNWFHLL